MLKVSVVIPTYRSGPELDRTIRSIDTQTLPQSEFEVIMIDDGSPDDTFDRLRAFATTRPNYRVSRIENSGWPSRPRNIGIDQALGEYVLFMDHDDEIAPETLAAAWELGARNRADAVNVKESRTQIAGWALPIFDRDHANALDRVDENPLGPMTPHKLYRREFLREHAIAFPEGGRVVNEDLYFNIEVLQHAQTISILAERAGYHWVTTGANNSTGYLSNPLEQVASLALILEFAVGRLSAPSRSAILETITTTLLSSQVLPLYARIWQSSGPDRAEVLTRCVELFDRFLTDAVIHRLDFRRRAIAELLRAGREDLFGSLDAFDRGLYGVGVATDVEWIEGRLSVRTLTQWYGDHGKNPQVRRSGDRVVADVGADLGEVLPADLIDVTEAVNAAGAIIAVRDRGTAASFLQHTEMHRTIEPDAHDGHTVRVTSHAHIDPGTAIFGRPLTDGIWDVFVRATLLVGHQQRRCSTQPLRAFALIDGRIALAYQTEPGKLGLDLTQRKGYRAEIVRRARPEDAGWERTGATRRLRIEIDGVHAHGSTTIPLTAVMGPKSIVARLLHTSRLPAKRMRSMMFNRLAPAPRAAIRGEHGLAFLEFTGRPSLIRTVLLVDAGGALIATGPGGSGKHSSKASRRHEPRSAS